MDSTGIAPKADLRERQGFSVQEKQDLLSAWESGMTTTKCKDLMHNLSETCGISKERIKAMILESVGYAIGGVGLDPQDPNNIRKGIRFFTSNAEKILDNNLFKKFENFFAKGEQENSVDKQKTDALRKQLRDHLNKSWAKSTGLKTNLPYSKIKNGTLEINIGGLPEGLVFKEPSSYGYKTILKLLQTDISFQIICSSNTVDIIPEINIQEVSPPHQDSEKDLPQNDIDMLINQIKRSSEETLASASKKQKTRSSKTVRKNDKSEVDTRKWYKVEKVIKKKGSRIYIKWADGSYLQVVWLVKM